VVVVLDFLKNSDYHPTATGHANAPRFANRARFRGHRGSFIPMHRALARFVLEPLDLVLSILLVLLFSFVWLAFLPRVCGLWRDIFASGTKLLALNAGVSFREYHFTPYLHFVIPYPHMEDVGPDSKTWWLTAAIVLVLFSASLFLPKKLIPLVYLLRAVLFVQASALLYFVLAPGRFPQTPDSYMEGLVSCGIALISAVPIVFGLTYYIFNFGLIRKALVTAVTMTHLSLFFPLQVLLQAIILQKTVLFMPVLYIVFGMPLDILIIVAFYSWGMSWPARKETDL